MGCFPTFFRHWRHNKALKNVPNQCSSPSNESAKLLPATIESMKEEEIVNPIKLVQETDNGETAVSDLNKDTNDDKLEETEKNEGIENKDNDSESRFLIDGKDCVAKEITFFEEESSDSLFSLSIDSRKQVFAVCMEDKEVNSPFESCPVLAKTGEIASLKCDEDKEMKCDEDKEVNSSFQSCPVLAKTGEVAASLKCDEDKEVNSPFQSCPVLAKTGEIAASLKCDEDKENVPLNNDLITIQSYDHHQLKKKEGEIGVDTSLSSWLVASEKSNKKSSMDSSPQSEKNYGEKEIIYGTEFKEMNGVLSGGSTPCCSGDDQLGIGTVGGYWRRRGRAEAVGAGGVLTVSTKV